MGRGNGARARGIKGQGTAPNPAGWGVRGGSEQIPELWSLFPSAAPIGSKLCPPSAKNVRFRGAEMMEKRL